MAISSLVYLLFFSIFASASGVAVSMSLLTLVALFQYRHELKDLARFPLFWPTLLFVAAVLASFAANGYFDVKSAGKLKYFLFYFVLVLGFVHFPRLAHEVKRFAVPLSLFLGAVAVLQFLGIFDPGTAFHIFSFPTATIPESNGHYFHARGLLYHHNPFAYGGVLLFHLSFGQALTSKSRFWPALAAAACVVAVLASCSRGAWVALAGSSLLVLATVARRQWGAFAVAAVTAALVATFLGGPLAKRLRDIRPSANSERIQLWTVAFQMFEDAPIFGQGFHEGFARKRMAYMTAEEKANPYFPTDPHSLYFDLLGTTGLFGTLAFLVFAAAALRGYYSALKREDLAGEDRGFLLGMLGAFYCFLIGAAFDSHHFHSQTLAGTIFFLALGQAIVFRYAGEKAPAAAPALVFAEV